MMIATTFLLSSLAMLPPAPAASRADVVASGADTLPQAARDTVPQALAAAAVRYLREHGVERPNGKLEIWSNSTRSPVRAQLSESTVAPETARGLFPLIERYAAEWPGAGPLLSTIRLDAPDGYAPMRTAVDSAAAEQGPRLENGGHVQDVMHHLLRTHSPPARGQMNRAIPAVLRIRVGADGAPEMVDVARLTGDAELDEYLVPLAFEMRFQPARLGGAAVPSWVSMPLTLEWH
ncbi:MAG TPA: energy transducer TonB [Longimicrobiaceae bacterium]|jgi:hypothetical protein|nr:energy transducer TonB [Longimicrobiaceae bacterium]